jgi:L-aminopeptidase/D-esterase-like protein
LYEGYCAFDYKMVPRLRVTGNQNCLTDVDGIKVGNFTDFDALSGVTVVLLDEAFVCGADVRGGAPGTREISLLDPVNLVGKADAVVLSGGSAFGLDAASGVMRYLEEVGRGYETRDGVRVPIVPAAIIYDLNRGKVKRKVNADSGYAACLDAKLSFPLGNVGAGTGAMAGSVKGGLGSASEVLANGVTVGGLAVVNSAGQVADSRHGGLYASYLELSDEFHLGKHLVIDVSIIHPLTSKLAENTVLGVVASDAELTKSEATRVAMMAHDGIARAIYPSHTLFDGDTVFALATGERKEVNNRARLISMIGAASADVLARAIIRGVVSAESVGKTESYRDAFPEAFKGAVLPA